MSREQRAESDFGSRLTYSAGFGLSLILTGFSFWLVSRHVNSHHFSPSDTFMITALALLSITQLLVQLIFFFHLDRESKPRWNNLVLSFAALVVVIIVFGSVWIMSNLNYHHAGYGTTHDGHQLTSPAQTNQYIINDEGIHP